MPSDTNAKTITGSRADPCGRVPLPALVLPPCPSHGLSIRCAQLQDLDALEHLEQQTFSFDRIQRRSWKHLLKSPSATLLVVERELRLLGCAIVLTRRKSRIARLYSLAVHPQHHGQGAGRALLHRACAVARAQGQRELRLESRIDNHRAHALFHSQGFGLWGQPVPHYYQDGTDALRFRLPLG